MENKKIKNFTINWFWLYRAFSYDFVFYYTVATLYYTTLKGFELSDVMMLHSITAVSTFLLLLPISWLIKKIGNTACIRIGTFMWIVYMLCTIFINNYYVLLMVETLCSCGTVMKILSDSVIITNTLEKHGLGDKYVKVESKGITTYFIVDSISAILAGYLFNINPQIPMILCLLFIAFSFVLSLWIKDETEVYKGWKYIGDSVNKSDLKEKDNTECIVDKSENSMLKIKPKNKYIGTKGFIIFLCFVASFYGLIMPVGYLQTIGLVSIEATAVEIGYIVVVCKLVNSLASWGYGKFSKQLNKNFPLIATTIFMFITLLLGATYTFVGDTVSKFWIVVVLLVMIECIKQPYKLFSKDHIRSHTSGDERQKFYTIYFMTESAGDFILCLAGSFMLESLSVGVTYLLLLGIMIIPIITSSILLYKASQKSKL